MRYGKTAAAFLVTAGLTILFMIVLQPG